MKHHLKTGMVISVVVLFSLVLAAFSPGVVYAEGDIPEAPPPEPVVEETPPEDVGSAVEALAESGAVIAAPDGSVVPLASQAALKVIGDPDPWFYCSVGCVGGKSPTYATINLALANWVSKKGYGFIFLEGGYNVNQTVSIDGDTYPTLKGIMWDKSPGPKPVVNGKLEIFDFKAGFTLQGLSNSNNATYAIYLHNNSGLIKLVDISGTNPGGYGIYISGQKGPVSITSVSVIDSGSYGLNISNTYYDGTKYVNTGNVTITNSAFLRNGGVGIDGNYAGLSVTSAGSILLNGVTASVNDGGGADLILYGVLPLVIRNSVFSHNMDNQDLEAYGFGIYTYVSPATSPVAITLDNVTLIGNEEDGAFLRTGGNITLNKVYAVNNEQHGVYISGEYDVDAVGAKNVTVSNSTFIRNIGDNNLEIHASGAVKITNLYSTGSGRDGLYVENSAFNTLVVPVTVLGAVLNGNDGNGAYITSDGTITMAGITAIANGGYGIYLDNWWAGSTGNIIISASLGLNQLNENTGGNGLYAGSFRNISISSVQANRNAYYGIYIGGYGATSNVTLLNVEASGNKGIGADNAGVSIIARGSVTLNKVTAGYNAGSGIYIKNEAGTYSRPVTISNSSANYNGYTGATDNNKSGIYVLSAGLITLNGVTASGNSSTGADLENATLSIPATQVYQGITVLKSTFDNNDSWGLDVLTRRKITLTSINAAGNYFTGVYATNATSEISSAIVVTGTNRFNHNGIGTNSSGIYLESQGLVSLSGITSLGNGYKGISIFTNLGVTVSNVVLVNNYYYGIEVSTSGPVTMGGLTVLNNGTSTNYSGVMVTSTTGSKVVINSGLILGNGAYGIQINVADPNLNAYVAPGVVVFGNDVVAPYEWKQVYIY